MKKVCSVAELVYEVLMEPWSRRSREATAAIWWWWWGWWWKGGAGGGARRGLVFLFVLEFGISRHSACGCPRTAAYLPS